MAKPPLLIPDSLPLAVPFADGWIAVPAPPPILRIRDPPFARTILANLTVFGIGGNLLAVIIGATPLLAPRFAANQLLGLKFGWLEKPITVPTPPLDHTGVVALNRAGEGFRSFYSVGTASPPMACFNNKTGENAVVLFRR